MTRDLAELKKTYFLIDTLIPEIFLYHFIVSKVFTHKLWKLILNKIKALEIYNTGFMSPILQISKLKPWEFGQNQFQIPNVNWHMQ